jgi:hypothetical protein
MADSADSTHPFVYPYGFIVFWLNLEFIDALTFCQDSDMDVMDFQFYGFNYLLLCVHFFSVSSSSLCYFLLNKLNKTKVNKTQRIKQNKSKPKKVFSL